MKAENDFLKVVIYFTGYNLQYMAKYLKGKTFAFRVENDYSLENFHDSMFVELYRQSRSTRQKIVGKDSWLNEKSWKPREFSPLIVLLYH